MDSITEEKAIQIVNFNNYSTFAGLSLYIHHLLSTVFAEVEIIWRIPRSPMKILYLINRYLGAAIVVTSSILSHLAYSNHISCNALFIFFAPAAAVLIGLVQLILAIRMNAILGNKRRYLTAIMALFLIEMTFVTFLSARYAKTETLTFGNATICNNALSWSLVPAIVFDTIMGSVIIYRAVLHVKTSRQMDIPASWGYGGRLLTTLMRDSIQYYMCILLVFLLVALSNLMTDALANIQPFLIPWIMIVPTSSATSMILHLHQVSSQDRCSIIDFDPDSPVELDTSIRFVHTASRNGLTPEVEA